MAISTQIQKRFSTEPQASWTVFANVVDIDSIKCLVDALSTADKPLTQDIENQLVKSATVALPLVLDTLAKGDAKQQATCAMVLLRWQATDALANWAAQHPQHQWKAQTLLDLMAKSAHTEKKQLISLV